MATEKPAGQQQPQDQQQLRDDETAAAAGADSRGESQPATVSVSSGGGQPTKCVYIFRNGDVFAPSKKFVLNRRQLRDWDVFLEQVTLSVNPLRGAVRTIVTPKRGRQRIQDLDAFEDKGHYVALAKGERFKPMGYIPEGDAAAADSAEQLNASGHQVNGASPVGSPRRPLGASRIVLEPILPVVHNKKLMSVQPRFGAKMDVISSQSKVIRVYRNGDEFTPAIITMLRPSEQASMEVVLRAVEEKVVLPNNMAIRKLYDLSGRRIRDPQELQHEKHYVAGGHEAFMPRPYGQKLPVIVVGKVERTENSAWSSIKYLSQPITPEKNATRRGRAEHHTGPAPAGRTGGGGRADKQQPMRAGPAAKAPKQPSPAPAGPGATREAKEKSASVIQSSFRGFQARKEAAGKLAQKPIIIKAGPSKPKQQQQQRSMTDEEKSAAKSIQASVNSYKTRKTVAKQQADKTPPA